MFADEKEEEEENGCVEPENHLAGLVGGKNEALPVGGVASCGGTVFSVFGGFMKRNF